MARIPTAGPKCSKNSKTKTKHGFTGVHEQMSQTFLEQTVKDMVCVAQQNLMNDGYLVPTLMIFIKDNVNIISLVGAVAMDQATEIIKTNESVADAFILINEGWLKDPTNSYRIGETINVSAKSRTGKYGAVCIFTRDSNNKPVLQKTVYSSEMYNRILASVF